MKKVGVVLLNKNRAALTILCVRSLLGGTMKPDKIIVVDNASSDGSADEIAAAFMDILLVRNKENRGFSAGNNIGIKILLDLNYEYIWVLNNDTELDNDCLKTQYDFMESRPDIAGCCGKILYSDSPKTIWYGGAVLNRFKLRIFHKGMLEEDGGQYDSAQETPFITGCSMFVRGQAWRSVGFLDDKFFAYDEDIDWCLRAGKRNLKLWYFPKAVIYHKVSAAFGKTEGIQTPWVAPPIVVYLSERNQLLLLKKWKSLPGLFFMYFLKIPRTMKFVLGFLLLNKFDNLFAFCRGTLDGIFDLHPENDLRRGEAKAGFYKYFS